MPLDRKYTWRLIFSDGSALSQTEGHTFEPSDLASPNLARVEWVPDPYAKNAPLLSVRVRPELGEHAAIYWLTDASDQTGRIAQRKAVLELYQRSGRELIKTCLLCHADGRIILSGSEDY